MVFIRNKVFKLLASLLILSMVLSTVGVKLAQATIDNSLSEAGNLPVNGFLNPDGTLNLASAPDGAFDLRGWNVALDAERGPIFFPAEIWLHIQDGTGATGTNDVTATTTGSAAVGATVLVRGKLAADKDLGFGYKYDVLIEDANVTVE